MIEKIKSFLSSRKSAKTPLSVSYEDITTDEYVSMWVTNVYEATSAHRFPRIDIDIYESIFEYNKREWDRFFQQYHDIPPIECWSMSTVIPNTILFEKTIAFNHERLTDDRNVTLNVSYTKQSSSYDEVYNIEIELEETCKIRINHLSSWSNVVKTLELMAFVVHSHKEKERMEEIAKIAAIYPEERR